MKHLKRLGTGLFIVVCVLIPTFFVLILASCSLILASCSLILASCLVPSWLTPIWIIWLVPIFMLIFVYWVGWDVERFEARKFRGHND